MLRPTTMLLLMTAPLAVPTPARADFAAILVDSRPSPVTLAADGSLSLTAPLSLVSGDGTPAHDFQPFAVANGSLTIAFGPATSGTLATGLTWSSGTITVTGNGHVLESGTVGPTVLTPHPGPGGVPFYSVDATPAPATLAPELAAFYGVYPSALASLGGNLQSVDGVLTATGGVDVTAVAVPLPAGAVPGPASLLLLAAGLAMAAIHPGADRGPRPRPTPADTPARIFRMWVSEAAMRALEEIRKAQDKG